MLRLVPLTSGAGTDEVLNVLAHAGEVEIAAESMERALDALVSVLMDRSDDLQDDG